MKLFCRKNETSAVDLGNPRGKCAGRFETPSSETMKRRKVAAVSEEGEGDESSEDDSSEGGMREVGNLLGDEEESEGEQQDVQVGAAGGVGGKQGSEKELQNEEEEEEEEEEGREKGYEIDLNAVDGKGELVQAEFSFCEPGEVDFSMTKELLLRGTAGALPQISGDVLYALATDVVEQGALGTTIKVDDSVFAFLSLLSVSHYGKRPYMEYILNHIRSECPTDKKEELKSLISSGVAVCFNERIINVPVQLIHPLHKTMVEDIKWARKNVSETGGSKDMFDFNAIIFVEPCYLGKDRAALEASLDGEDVHEEDGKRNSISKRKRKKQEVESKPIFQHFEGEDFLSNCTISFPCKLTTKAAEGKGAIPQKHRPKQAMVSILTLDQYRAIIPSLSAENK